MEHFFEATTAEDDSQYNLTRQYQVLFGNLTNEDMEELRPVPPRAAVESSLYTTIEPSLQALTGPVESPPTHEAGTQASLPEIISMIGSSPEVVQLKLNTPHMTISNLENYLDIAGNKVKNIYFMTLRFKNPVIVPHGIANSTICINKDQCIAIDRNYTSKITSKEGGLVFVFDHLNRTKGNVEHELLKCLFPKQDFVFSVFHIRTLYVASYHNPFQTIWRVIRKGVAFQALVKMLDSCVLKTCPFTIDIAAMMRHFKRNKTIDLFNFSNWYPMARMMCEKNYRTCYYHAPTTEYGHLIYKICKRSKEFQLSANHPPPEFYTCQITLDDTKPVGIACSVVDNKVEYVSTFVVSYTDHWFLDTNRTSCCFSPSEPRYAKCRYWFPLLKDKETWLKYGLGWYLQRYVEKMCEIKMVLKTLVETLLRTQREPHNLLHTQLLRNLKRDVQHDVTEAFTISQPLVEKYPEVYRRSTSFVDFLFRMCHVDLPSSVIPKTHWEHSDLKEENQRLSDKIEALQKQLEECRRLNEVKIESSPEIQNTHLSDLKEENQRLSDKIEALQKQLEECRLNEQKLKMECSLHDRELQSMKKQLEILEAREKELQALNASSSDTLQLMHDTFTDTLKQLNSVQDKKIQTMTAQQEMMTELHNIVQPQGLFTRPPLENDGMNIDPSPPNLPALPCSSTSGNLVEYVLFVEALSKSIMEQLNNMLSQNHVTKNDLATWEQSILQEIRNISPPPALPPPPSYLPLTSGDEQQVVPTFTFIDSLSNSITEKLKNMLLENRVTKSDLEKWNESISNLMNNMTLPPPPSNPSLPSTSQVATLAEQQITVSYMEGLKNLILQKLDTIPSENRTTTNDLETCTESVLEGSVSQIPALPPPPPIPAITFTNNDQPTNQIADGSTEKQQLPATKDDLISTKDEILQHISDLRLENDISSLTALENSMVQILNETPVDLKNNPSWKKAIQEQIKELVPALETDLNVLKEAQPTDLSLQDVIKSVQEAVIHCTNAKQSEELKKELFNLLAVKDDSNINAFIEKLDNIVQSKLNPVVNSLKSTLDAYLGRLLPDAQMEQVVQMFRVDEAFQEMLNYLNENKKELKKATRICKDNIVSQIREVVRHIVVLYGNKMDMLPIVGQLNTLEERILEKDQQLASRMEVETIDELKMLFEQIFPQIKDSPNWQLQVFNAVVQTNANYKDLVQKIENIASYLQNPNLKAESWDTELVKIFDFHRSYAINLERELRQSQQQFLEFQSALGTIMQTQIYNTLQQSSDDFFRWCQTTFETMMRTLTQTNQHFNQMIQDAQTHYVYTIEDVTDVPENPLALTNEEKNAITYVSEDQHIETQRRLENEIEELKNQLAACTQLEEEHRETQRGLQDEIDHLKNQLASCTQLEEEHREMQRGLRDEIDHLKNQLAACTQLEEEHIETQRGLQDEIDQLNNQLAACKKSEKQHKDTEKKLQDDIAQMNAAYTQLQGQHTETEKKLQDDIAQMNAAYTQLQGQHTETEKRLRDEITQLTIQSGKEQLQQGDVGRKSKLKRKRGFSDDTDAVELTLLKKYFLYLYKLYFETIWGFYHVPDDKKPLFQEKINIMKRITPSDRPNDLLDICKTYMECDLQRLVDDKSVLQELEARLENVETIKELLQTCTDEARKHCERLAGTSAPLSSTSTQQMVPYPEGSMVLSYGAPQDSEQEMN
ncbi:hypothetical protein JTE90_022641 [Oedothorax gibbosus]|uniref:Uncharacterized protein n=1 Tax=Oedothorax gibbosus TaxID=931172 RepID=A0AAV6TUC2_9ARAC|nr:hypothetical protein JTE90_022641 [Oedothorax gibbosus]